MGTRSTRAGPLRLRDTLFATPYRDMLVSPAPFDARAACASNAVAGPRIFANTLLAAQYQDKGTQHSGPRRGKTATELFATSRHQHSPPPHAEDMLTYEGAITVGGDRDPVIDASASQPDWCPRHLWVVHHAVALASFSTGPNAGLCRPANLRVRGPSYATAALDGGAFTGLQFHPRNEQRAPTRFEQT